MSHHSRPAFHVDDDLRKASIAVAKIFEREEREEREVREAYRDEAIDAYINSKN